jgi:hydroxymethylglutaryl-CoA reductase (NADPH)
LNHLWPSLVYTLSFFAILASTTYISLLETGFFQPTIASGVGKVDFGALSAGSRRLQLSEDTAWKWQVEENGAQPRVAEQLRNDIALVTLAFPDSGASVSPNALLQNLSLPKGSSIEVMPSSENILSTISSDTALAFSMPYHETAQFLESVKEIPAVVDVSAQDDGSDDEPEQKMWLMKSSKVASSGSLVDWAKNSWTAFLDLVKNAETLDIIIMSLGYISMYLTFISLFTSMRRLGSNFWLGTSVLFSSAMAFLFGLMVTMKMGVPVNVVLLSEGLPFLVVTVGFEKPIILTQAVLSAAIQGRRTSPPGSPNSNEVEAPLTIQNAVQTAVRERGFEIVRDYAVEIAILCVGAASGIQGGLRQFCFLAAWTLFFDCIMLFTFYTAILTIKLEITRIKRHVATRKALEEDGVSKRVAETVASSNDWPRDDFLQSSETSIFGRKVKDSSIPRFKVLMVTGFLLINLLNLCTMPFRGANPSPVNVMSQLPMDPFKVAGSALDHLSANAKAGDKPLSVTVFNPVKYDLQFPSVHYSPAEKSDWSMFEVDYSDGVFSAVGGRVVESILKSFEDPVFSKWVIIALVFSLVLNGYLFNAARWSIRGSDNGQNSTAAAPAINGHAVAPKAENPEDRVFEDLSPLDEVPNGSVNRSKEEAEAMVKAGKATTLTDNELVDLSLRGKIPGYALEKTLGDKVRAVKIRRSVIARTSATKDLTSKLENSLLPYKYMDYDRVFGACCENVIGYTPLPIGVAGPLTIDGRSYFLPMTTTEGVLVASVSRGCKAINAGGGAVTVLTGDGMTRGPCVGFETLSRAAAAKIWLDSVPGQKVMKDAFNSTSRFARLQEIKSTIAGTYVYIRFKTTTGDAMGMNMISKGVEHALSVMSNEAGFGDMAIITVSGNYCTDKKPAAINWIDGRGKSVVAEAIIPGDVVRSVLKSDVDALVELNISKNLIGSAMAGSIGGFNAHAANIVTAIFLATGQDPAQNVESSNCITVMRK